MENEDDKKFEFVKGAEFEIKEMQLELDSQDPMRVAKITFATSVGDITWKPKVERISRRHGFLVKTKDQVTLEELSQNENIEKINSMLKIFHKVRVIGSFGKMTKNESTYRFIQVKTLEKFDWQVLPPKAENSEIDVSKLLKRGEENATGNNATSP